MAMELRRFERVSPDGEILEFGKSHMQRRLEAKERASRLGVTAVEVERAYAYLTTSASTGETYRMTRLMDGWICTCKGFTYSGQCKHLGAVEARAEAEGWIFGLVSRG